MIIILLPDIWFSCTLELLYSWTLVSPIPLSPVLSLLLIAQSYQRPAKHAWCQDDEDVFHDCASVRRILNGTKCHTEQSATPYKWWGPPLESVGATSRIIPHIEQSATQSKVPYHTRGGGHVLNLWGLPLKSVGLPPESTLRAKYHMEQSVTPHMWWEPPLESVGATFWICMATFFLLPVPPGVSKISILNVH